MASSLQDVRLLAAVANDDCAEVKRLLAEGAKADAKAAEGTALHYAVQNGNVEIVAVLLANGANRGATNKSGLTAYDLAQSLANRDIRDLLKQPNGTHGNAGKAKPQLISTANSYTVGPGKSNISGQHLEYKMVTLVYLRLKLDPGVARFKIGSNVPGFGKFDDLVVKVYRKDGSVVFWFVQLKHSGRAEVISSEYLLSNKSFNLESLFHDYLALGRELSKSQANERVFDGDFETANIELVFFTPLKSEIDSSDAYVSKSNTGENDLLRTLPNGQKLRFKEDALERFESFDPQVLERFRRRLVIYTDQAKHDELDQIAVRELAMVDDMDISQAAKTITNMFKSTEHYWQKQDDKPYLTETDETYERAKCKAVLDSLKEACSFKITKHNLKFTPKSLASLESDNFDLDSDNRKIFIISNAPQLIVAKLMQKLSLESQQAVAIVDCDNVGEHVNIFATFVKSDFNTLLLICSSDQALRDISTEIKSTNFNGKNVAILSTKQASSLFANFDAICDQDVNLADFTDHCQTFILSKTVQFQGIRMPLAELVDGLPRHSIEGGLILKLLDNQNCVIFGKTSNQHKQTTNCYVERKMRGLKVNKRKILSSGLYSFVRRKSDIPSLKLDIIVLADNRDLFAHLCRNGRDRNIHWMVDRGDFLMWKESSSRVSNLKAFLENSPQQFAVETLADFDNRVTIIAGDPGIGKSTLTAKLEENWKRKDFPLIVRIDLLQCVPDLTQLEQCDRAGNKVDAVEFVYKQLLKSHSDASQESVGSSQEPINYLRKKIFEKFHKNDKLFILFDGFDEISPLLTEVVLKLLKCLQRNQNGRMVITTRSTRVQSILEDGLSLLSRSLEPFAEDDVQEYFQKFLTNIANSNHLGLPSAEKEIKISLFHQKFFQICRDQHKNLTFFSVPLHCKMMASLLKDSFLNFCGAHRDANPSHFIDQKTLNLLDLFHKFIRTKFELYWAEKCKLDINNPNFDCQKEWERFLKKHTRLAIRALFEGRALDCLLPPKSQAKHASDLNDMSEKEGVICSVINGIPSFVHRTFAEYLIAIGLWDRILHSSVSKLKCLLQTVVADQLIARDEQQICEFLRLAAMKQSHQISKDKINLLIRVLYGVKHGNCSSAKLLSIVNHLIADKENIPSNSQN